MEGQSYDNPSIIIKLALWQYAFEGMIIIGSVMIICIWEIVDDNVMKVCVWEKNYDSSVMIFLMYI